MTEASQPARGTWLTKRLKYAARLNADTLSEETPPERAFRYVDISGVDGFGQINAFEETTFEKAPSRARRLATPNDVILSTVRTYLRAIAKAPRDASEFVFSTGFAVLHPDPTLVDQAFLWWTLQGEQQVQWIVAHSQGIGYPSINPAELGLLRLPLPTLGEQSAIAIFLDRETARIDALIAKKERLLELLDEKRTALITQAVTKGLDPSVPMKESGVEWLGEVPAHWDLTRGRFLFERVELPPRDGDSVVTAFRDGQVTLRENRRTEGYTFAIEEQGYQHVRPGDLVIHGMDGFAGAIGVSDSHGKCSPEYVVLTSVGRGVSNEYYAHALRLMAKRGFIQVISNAVRERAPRFRLEQFKDVVLPVPLVTEQNEIANVAGAARERSTGQRTTIRRAIALLREYRTALISAAVTGQIDTSNRDTRL